MIQRGLIINGIRDITKINFSYALFISFLLPAFLLVSCDNDRAKQKTRIIFDTDANNELDDQHALAYLLFNGDHFYVEGITVNKTKNGGNINQHYKEAERVVRLCSLTDEVDIYKGANGSFNEIKPHIHEPEFDGEDAVNFIISKAKASDEKLLLMPVGKLTNVALALYKDSTISDKVKIVWLGSNYPEPGEYNQEDDPAALQYILESDVSFEIVLVRYDKPTGTAAVKAYLSDIQEYMPGKGPQISPPVTGRHGKEFRTFGDYSVSLFENIDEYDDEDAKTRALYDMAALAVVKNPSWADSTRIPAPELLNGIWKDRPNNPREIIIWENFEKEKIIEDFYNTMENYNLVNSAGENDK